MSQVLPVVDAAKRTSVALTDAYLAQALKRQPLGVNPDTLNLRNGTPPEEVYERPFVTVWTALGAGTQWQDAVTQGLNRATSTAEMDAQLAFRATADEIGRADDGIFGYQRVADGGACVFCSEVDGAYVKSADAMALHNHCGCGLEPLTEPHSRAAELPSGVAVRDHGELGAVLTDPSHSFETAALALS